MKTNGEEAEKTEDEEDADEVDEDDQLELPLADHPPYDPEDF